MKEVKRKVKEFMVVKGNNIEQGPEKEIVNQFHPDARVSVVFEKNGNPVKFDIIQDQGAGKNYQINNIIKYRPGFMPYIE